MRCLVVKRLHCRLGQVKRGGRSTRICYLVLNSSPPASSGTKRVRCEKRHQNAHLLLGAERNRRATRIPSAHSAEQCADNRMLQKSIETPTHICCLVLNSSSGK